MIMSKYIKMKHCYFKKKDAHGNWEDNLDRPAVVIYTRYAKIKFSIDDLDYVIEELMKLKNEEE